MKKMEKTTQIMSRLLVDPLFRFLVGGIIIFTIYWFFSTQEQKQAYHISVNDGQVQRLKSAWRKEKKRTITREELKNLVQSEVEEEILFREAVRIGLDKGDRIIKRRLIQKYRFMLNDAIIVPEPEEQTLRQHFNTHLTAYQMPGRLSFDHHFFSNSGRVDPYGDAAIVMLKLNSKGHIASDPSDPSISSISSMAAVGDSFLGPSRVEGQTEKAVNRVFGVNFFDQLREIKTGEWSYPIESAYGWHLVYVHGRTGSQTLSFDTARNQVLTDWREAKRLEARAERLKKLQEKYTIKTPPQLSDTIEIAGKYP